MSRILLKTNKGVEPGWIEAYEYGDRIINTCESIFSKNDNHLYLIFSRKHTGINRHSGARYYRWENISVYGLRRNRKGTLIAYGIRGKEHVSPSYVWGIFENRRRNKNGIQENFQQYATEMFGINHWYDVFPIAKHYEVATYSAIPSMFINASRSTSSREFVERVFGKKQYRKDLLKATGALHSMYPLYVAQAFRGLVPIDWIINFLKLEHNVLRHEYGMFLYRDIRPLVSQMDPRSYKRLLNAPITTDTLYQIDDTMRSIEIHGAANDNYYRTWGEVHDRNAIYRGHITVFKDQPIELIPLAKKIHGLTTKSFEIQAATETSQLTEWGMTMHNCIGGYKTSAAKGNTVLGAVYSKSKMIANFEINPKGQLRQLLGPCNKPLPTSQKNELEEAFKKVGINVQGYWGANGDLF